MTGAPEIFERAEANAAEWERNRKAWNLPRRPTGAKPGAAAAHEKQIEETDVDLEIERQPASL